MTEHCGGVYKVMAVNIKELYVLVRTRWKFSVQLPIAVIIRERQDGWLCKTQVVEAEMLECCLGLT